MFSEKIYLLTILIASPSSVHFPKDFSLNDIVCLPKTFPSSQVYWVLVSLPNSTVLELPEAIPDSAGSKYPISFAALFEFHLR